MSQSGEVAGVESLLAQPGADAVLKFVVPFLLVAALFVGGRWLIDTWRG